MHATLFYIHDPMCSWCYAFEKNLFALRQALPAEVQVINLVGGLAPDTIETMPKSLQQTIQQIWHRIEQTVSGVKFNHNFWTTNTPMRSTYPACRAVLAAKKQHFDAEQLMIHAIQTAYYQQAKNPSLAATLIQCALDIGLDVTEFERDLISSEIEAQLQQEINMVQSMRVKSYPSLCLQNDGQLSNIEIDYLDHRTMLNEIAKLHSFFD